MAFLTQWPLEDICSNLSLSQLGTGVLVFYLAYRYVAACQARSKLDKIPTVGHDGIISSYLTAWRTFTDGFKLIEEGCRKYPGGAFKIPTLTGWQVVVNGPVLINDLRRATDEELSANQALCEDLQASYTMSPALGIKSYHADVARTPLTRNIVSHFDDILDETCAAFADNIPLQDDWVEIPVVRRIQNVVVRISNRVFVGLPLCRDPDWCDLIIQFTIDVTVNATIIHLFPKILHPIVGRIFTTKNRTMRRTMRHLGPIIKQRLETGERPMVFTHALYHLAANPELIRPLRREVENVVENGEGWTKRAMLQLRLVDSFLKESQRRVGLTMLTISRIALKDFKFSDPDGTVVPAGARVAAAGHYAHTNEETYPTPSDFVPFRFAEMEHPENTKRHGHDQMVTTTPDWLLFGGGKHACPGRFFAVTKLKVMFAHLILNYDVKFRQDGAGFPPAVQFGSVMSPNPDVKVMFRKRDRNEMEL
ncbi:hypothetical protein V5O48_006310 [Marasmius crinis-equi]|uniref:Cytochrome P450 n=1 Tax=Marasmius crinis-equi TaxID=585013 RepID=A0ABR3FJU1_9AGAR